MSTLVCDPAAVASWSVEDKAEFIRWYEASRYSAKIPGATECYNACKA